MDVDIKCRLMFWWLQYWYMAVRYGEPSADSLEKTLLKFCKLVLGVPNSATTDAVLGELARFPLWTTTQFCAVHRRGSTWVGYGGNEKSWYIQLLVGMVLQILLKTDKTNFHLSLSEFGQRCEDCFVQNWHASLGNDLHRRHGGRNKLRTYRRFKHSFEWEPYLTYVKSPPLRTVLCRFCIRCHLLEIERGRYQRPKLKPAHQHYMSELSTTG